MKTILYVVVVALSNWPCTNHKTQRYSEMVNAAPDIGTEEPMPDEFLTAFNCLWADKGVQLTILKGNQYALHDNLSLCVRRNPLLLAR